MSDHAARAALTRMNLREVAVAAHYTAMANDLCQMAATDPEKAAASFLARRGEMCAPFGLEGGAQSKPFAFANGVAVIPISGSLINRFGGSYGWVTGYNFIRSQLNLAMADDDVKGIIFDVNSYGGEAAGCFELAADIRSAREKKPSMAVVDSNAYSAGYALASAAGKVVCTPSGGVGSIGVLTMHVDMSKMLTDAGMTVTLIYEAEHKVDGNPFAPLPDSVKAEIQAGIHKSYEAFVAVAAANRNMDEKKIRETKSRTYRADDALSLGLIDAIATPSEAARAFLSGLSGSTLQLNGAKAMTQATNEPGDKNASNSANQQAIDSAAADARKAERARIVGITGSEEAKGRTALANHLAMNTELSAESARAILAAAPTEAAAAAPVAETNPFKDVMNASKHPNVGTDAASGGDEESPVSRILSAQRLATGQKAAA